MTATEALDLERVKRRYQRLWDEADDPSETIDKQMDLLLDEVPLLIEEIERLRKEVASLQSWKREASIVGSKLLLMVREKSQCP